MGRHFLAMRTAIDLDATLAASVDEVAVALREIGWTRHATKEHEWRAADVAKVDISPAGARHLAAGELAWPESGDVMSLVGFRHVFIAPRAEVIDAGLTVRVARARLRALLEMVAYMDRPPERTPDLGDRALLPQECVHADDDRRFSDRALAGGLSFENVPACVLGRDLAGHCEAARGGTRRGLDSTPSMHYDVVHEEGPRLFMATGGRDEGRARA